MTAAVTPGGHGLGRIPDLGDVRDFRAEHFVELLPETPDVVDLRPDMPPVGDQGTLGSCTAWASLAAWRYARIRQGFYDSDPSELAQYYWTRVLEDTTGYDSGASIRNSIKALNKFGVAPESLWPYDITRFTKIPSAKARRAAQHYQVLEYAAVRPNQFELELALAQFYPVVFGISVYPSFEAATSGAIPLPDLNEKLLGGHAIVLVGYDRITNRFLFRNSWGRDWGDGGYGYLPYSYVLHPELASDFWVIRAVEG